MVDDRIADSIFQQIQTRPQEYSILATLNLNGDYISDAATAIEASIETRRNLVIGCVGDGAGLEFLTWVQELDLPDPEVALMDPDSVDFPERGDRLYAALSAVAGAVASDPTPDRWLAGWRVLEKAAQQSPDIGAIAARVLAQIRPDGVSAPPEASIFLPVLEAAGLLE